MRKKKKRRISRRDRDRNPCLVLGGCSFFFCDKLFSDLSVFLILLSNSCLLPLTPNLNLIRNPFLAPRAVLPTSMRFASRHAHKIKHCCFFFFFSLASLADGLSTARIASSKTFFKPFCLFLFPTKTHISRSKKRWRRKCEKRTSD